MRSKEKRKAESGKRIPKPTTRRRKYRRIFVLGMMVAVALVAAAPTIVSRSPLRNVILNSQFASRVQCEQAVFSWLGGQSLEGLTIVDETGVQVLAVESISVNRSLVQLLTSTSELGKIQIVQPRLQLTTRADGSNLEDFIRWELEGARRELLDPELTPPNSQLPTLRNMQVEIVDGAVEGHDQTTNGRWMLSGFNAQLQMASGIVTEASGEGVLVQELGVGRREARVGREKRKAESGKPITPSRRLVVENTPTPNSPGNFKFRLHQNDANQQQLDVVADRLALGAVSPWFARAVPGGQIAGTVSLDGVLVRELQGARREARVKNQVTRASRPPTPNFLETWHSSGKLEASRLRISADALQGDVLQCERLTAPWQLTANGNLVSIEQLSADTEWGHVAAEGSLDIAQKLGVGGREAQVGARRGGDDKSSVWGSRLSAFRFPLFFSLPNQDGQLEARIDLAQLAAMLPSTLRIRRRVRIDSGDLKLVAKSLTGSEGSSSNRRKWTTQLALQNLAGSEGSRSIRWDQPVELQLDLEQLAPRASQLPTISISRLKLQSPFLEANLKTAADVVDGNFSFDLEKLADQVGQLVDLSSWQLRGQGSGTMVLQSLADGRFKATARIDLQGVESWKARGASQELGVGRREARDNRRKRKAESGKQ